MKTNLLLLLASLAAVTAQAGASLTRLDADTVVLPTCVVEAPRQEPAAARLQASLAALRERATVLPCVRPDLALLQLPAPTAGTIERAVKAAKSARLAKN